MDKNRKFKSLKLYIKVVQYTMYLKHKTCNTRIFIELKNSGKFKNIQGFQGPVSHPVYILVNLFNLATTKQLDIYIITIGNVFEKVHCLEYAPYRSGLGRIFVNKKFCLLGIIE